MALNPLKVFVFVVGGTFAAAATAFYSGALKSESRLLPETAANGTGGASVSPRNEPASFGPETAGGREDKPAALAAPGESAGRGPPPAGGSDARAANAQPEPSRQAALPNQAGAPVPDAPGDALNQTGEAVSDPAEAEAMPTFDLVRVEPNGDMVVAGHAARGAKVDLVAGGTVLGSATSSDAGEFAVVLDQPLRPGDHQIQISATTPDGETETSMQTALVSVPKDENGQVLAMVEEPGAPSRLLTVPEAAAPAGSANQPAGGAPPGNSRSEAAPSPSSAAVAPETDSEAVPPVRESAAAASAVSAAGPDTAAGASAPAGTSAPAATAKAASGAQADVAVQAVEIEGRKIYVAGRAAPGSAVRIYADDLLLGDARTSPAGQFLVEAVRDLPVGTYTVRADVLDAGGSVVARAAVPFEREAGDSVAAVAPELQRQADQQAGGGSATSGAVSPQSAAPGAQPAETPRAEPGSTQPVGAGETSSASAASVAQESPEQDGAQEGGSAAPGAVSPQPAAQGSQPARASRAARAPSQLAAGARNEARSASADATGAAPADGAAGTPANRAARNGTAAEATGAPERQGSAALPDASASAQPGTGAVRPAGEVSAQADQQSPRAAGTTAGGAASDTAAAAAGEEGETASAAVDLETSARAVAAESAGAAGANAPDTGLDASTDELAYAGEGVAPAPGIAAPAGAQAAAAAQGAAGTAGSEPVTAIAPKLQNVDAAIIIRRGDSLWRISRRVYGYGTRYSTIYLANSDQIRDPDLILPGQVFAVPARSQQGEEADLAAIERQITAKPAQAADE